MKLSDIRIVPQPDVPAATVEGVIAIDAPIAFDVDVSVEWLARDGRALHAFNLRQNMDVAWLPRGEYRFTWSSPRLRTCDDIAQLRCTAYSAVAGSAVAHDQQVIAADVPAERGTEPVASAWDIMGVDRELSQLSWRKGHEDWFFRHFDHAARTVASYMLGDSPLLQGRVLDVGCGDGITDLGVALRCRPELMIGIDPFRGFDRLPQVLRDNGLPDDLVPDNLRFLDADGNHLPFPDDSFDVVVSWGSVEHIAGGYLQALREIKRVLRDGGLFFVHPGLYYSNYGHHLGEFSSEPFFHLKWPRERLREFVLGSTPRYMDRAGEFATSAQYWQWFTELNPITVSGFERELRALEFEPWRVAIRTEDRIEYTSEILAYPMQDLAATELYLSCYNRKSTRPAGYGQVAPERFFGTRGTDDCSQ